ncbi:MAG: ABC transporter substrate-binding protein [Chloroflexota bacterium]|nr:ABC transporter substrate-binding protein [Chloroflexota bacterium]MDQ6906848.1 ABC transporter substrate-binding protein [Chloroflexota bacterium]
MRTTPTGQSSYRLTRRGFLTVAGASAAAAILAACGGATGPATQQASPAATSPAKPGQTPVAAAPSPAAVAAQAKPGGKLVIRWWTGDPPDLDPYLNVTFRSQEFGGFFYSRLLKYDSGPSVTPNSFAPVPDLAEKYEVSSDGLTYTFTLRANAKWQNKDPMNGRAVTADDVVWSFDRFRKISPNRNYFDVVKEVKATDPRTVVFTLNNVFAPFENSVAAPVFYIMPKEVIEADGDARKRVIGSGPWIFDKYDKGVQVVAKRNPDYYFTGTPNVDEVDLLIVPEDATAVANMRAKQIDINALSQSDRKGIVTSNPEIKLLDYPQNQLYFMYWRVDAPPFNDIRVRQAVSLAIDRDEMISVLWEGTGFLNNALPAGQRSWYLDPRSADMGPSAKYYKRDVDAAKKLLADAGFAGGLKVPIISSLNAYGNVFNSSIELVIKQLKDAGIQADLRPQDYAAYIGSTFLGKFDPGTMVWGLETPFQEPHEYLFNMYHPKGVRNHAGVNDPKLTDMVEKQAITLDKSARKAMILDIQRYTGEQQYYVFGVAGNTTIATQPWVKNFFYESDYARGGEWVPKVSLDGKPT